MSGWQETAWAADELRVTSVLSMASSLWVGAADGTLLIYDVTSASVTQQVDTEDQPPPLTTSVDDQVDVAQVLDLTRPVSARAVLGQNISKAWSFPFPSLPFPFPSPFPLSPLSP